ncbi:hypothetical protein KY334_04030 [Candidatus Woesearchaeota archaeon]|nr:hypothetical protein [Candidatus Woesearchaeota archaeon]
MKLDEFIREFKLNRKDGTSYVSLEDLEILKNQGYSTENLLDYLCQNNNSLLHGSRSDFEDEIKPRKGKIYCANLGSIAILKSIFSNKGSTLSYDYDISENNPLKLKIKDLNENTIGENGFVYVVNNTDDFINHPEGSWQYIKYNPSLINAKIEIKRDDFNYPIYLN